MSRELKRDLGLVDVFAIASGAMISSGLFILPALAYAAAGPSVVFSYILAGVFVLPALLVNAELATAMPKAGGTYFFIERSMGAPVGTIGGFASWFSLSLKSAFALVGMSIFVTLIFPGISEFQVKLIAAGFCLFFMTLNIMGVKETGRLQVGLVFFLIAILLLYIIRGFMQVDPSRFVPFAPHGAASVFATAGLVFVSFGGLTKVTSVAEEVRNPSLTIPLGMFLAFFVVMLLYAVVVFVTVGVLDAKALSGSLTPISDGAGITMGRLGTIILSLGALFAFISTANAGILAASRDGMAMSRDYLLPTFLQKVSSRSKTPVFSIILTTFFMISVIIFLSLENLVKTASTLMILLFLFVNLSLIVMRESRIQSYRPKFRCPLYPWVQIAGILGYSFLIVSMGKIPLLTTAVFILCSLLWYILYARRRVKRQAALVHIIERITAKELVNPTLPDELRDIIIERDEIVEDRFDHVIKESIVLDFDKSLSRDDFFKNASRFLSEKFSIRPQELTELFIKREEESHTVIRQGLAIPHIVIEGKKKFCILIARAKKGIIFPHTTDPVHTVFMLVGTRDERNFHLRALAAIAQIAQGRDFDKKWLTARNPEELRAIILLSERKRFGVI